MTERMITANGVRLCTEPFGDPADPPVLLMHGNGGSMVWWEDDFCRMLAGAGRFVIRYDQRDTGLSVTYEHGRPGYTGSDLIDDAAGVIEAYGLPAAHVIGLSAGGGAAQLLALDHPGRVLSLTLISTSPATSEGRAPLPPPTDAFMRFVSTATVDWSDPESVVEYLVDFYRVLAGDRRPFDDAGFRDLARRDVARADDPGAAQNHDVIPDDDRARRPLSSIAVPTLVVHGTADPMFPPAHGEALAAAIPGARLLLFDAAGHGLYRSDWEAVVDVISELTYISST